MTNVKVVPFPQALHDFSKTNGERPVFRNTDPSMTRQEFAEECDINALMKRYEGKDIGAIMRNVNPPQYIDFGTMPKDLMEFMQLQQDAEAAFMTLPAVVRKEFENDPVQFVEFAGDPANLEQMRTWGLAPPAKAQEEPKSAPAPVGQEAAKPAPAPAKPAAAPAAGAPTHGST